MQVGMREAAGRRSWCSARVGGYGIGVFGTSRHRRWYEEEEPL